MKIIERRRANIRSIVAERLKSRLSPEICSTLALVPYYTDGITENSNPVRMRQYAIALGMIERSLNGTLGEVVRACIDAQILSNSLHRDYCLDVFYDILDRVDQTIAYNWKCEFGADILFVSEAQFRDSYFYRYAISRGATI
jgi:hypothetical protein